MAFPRDNSWSLYLAHLVAAAVALLAAGIVQYNWATALTALGTRAWWPFVFATLVTATAWLLSAAWLHWRLIHSDDEPIERMTRLGVNAITDLLVATLAGVSIYRGPESRVLLAGLSLVPPCLLATAAASIIVLLWAMADTWRMRETTKPRGLPPRARDRWRIAIVIALFVSIGLLGSRPLPGQPQSRRVRSAVGLPAQEVCPEQQPLVPAPRDYFAAIGWCAAIGWLVTFDSADVRSRNLAATRSSNFQPHSRQTRLSPSVTTSTIVVHCGQCS